MAEQTTIATITVDMGDGEVYALERLPNGCYRSTAGSSGITWTVLGDSPNGDYLAKLFTAMGIWRNATETNAQKLNGIQETPAALNA